MTLSFIIDRLYWGAVILVPLGYAFLNFQAFKQTGKTYLFVMCLFSISSFFTSALTFLIRNSALIQGNVSQIRYALLIIVIIRSPLDLWLYSRLFRDFASQLPKPASTEQPNQSPDPTSLSVTPPAGQESRRP